MRAPVRRNHVERVVHGQSIVLLQPNCVFLNLIFRRRIKAQLSAFTPHLIIEWVLPVAIPWLTLRLVADSKLLKVENLLFSPVAVVIMSLVVVEALVGGRIV